VNHPDIQPADRSYLEGDEGAKLVPTTLPPSPAQRATAHLDTPCADFELSGDGFRLGNAKVLFEHPFRAFNTIMDFIERGESPDSLANHMHSSDEPSLPSSGILTRRNSTPGPIYNGVGAWTGDSFFVVSPLPLAPQWQIPSQPRFQHISQNNPASEEHPKTIPSEDLDDDTG
jgi:hypothetical protein